MQAVVLPQFGDAELFEIQDIERPTPGPGEVLVRVVASGTNPVDTKLRAGGSWAGLNPPVVLGYDAAGIVEEVGPGVTDFQAGDEVYYTPEIFGNQRGSYAEYNVARADIMAKKPANLSFTDAAAIPLAGGTAWEAITRRLQLQPGETVLIQAGAGGVGSFAVQFARAAGARVLATASTENQETLRELGAHVPIDYTTEDFVEIAKEETGGRGVDAVLEIAGENRVARSLPAMRPFGRMATILPPQGDLTALYLNNITLYGVFLSREGERLEEMRPVFERGQAQALVDQVLPLADVDQAHARLETGHGRGKVVLQVSKE